MHKLTLSLLFLTISISAKVIFPTPPGLSTSTNNKDETINIEISQRQSQEKLSVVEWVKKLFKNFPDPNAYKQEFCSIWPNGDNSGLLITSQARVFVLPSTKDINVKKIEIIELDNFVDKLSIWTTNDEEIEQAQRERIVRYSGAKLNSGQRYKYKITYEIIVNGNTEEFVETINFKIIEEEKRKKIETELLSRGNSIQTLKAEDRAMDMAEYYVNNHKLWADAIQELFLVQNSSLDKLKNEIVSKICPSSTNNEQN